jgi:hypothetical protein
MQPVEAERIIRAALAGAFERHSVERLDLEGGRKRIRHRARTRKGKQKDARLQIT